MVENWIRGRICDENHHYAKANNEHMKYYDKNKNHPILNIRITYTIGWCLKSIW